MYIYHGSNYIITTPIWGYGNAHNDYGLGFYCTEDEMLACEWAVDDGVSGYANRYDLPIDGLSVLDLNSGNYVILHWLAILLANRTFQAETPLGREAKRYIIENFLPDYEHYDVIVGYRADDSYFSFARDFIDGGISLTQLSEAMKLGRLGNQIVLKSKRAFDQLKYVDSEVANCDIWYPKKEQRDTRARRQYADMDKIAFHKGEIYVLKIIEEELKADDLKQK